MPNVNAAAYDDDIALVAGQSTEGDNRWAMGFTEEEMLEIIALIDDEPVDEQLLTRIRNRFRKKLKAIRNGLNPARQDG